MLGKGMRGSPYAFGENTMRSMRGLAAALVIILGTSAAVAQSAIASAPRTAAPPTKKVVGLHDRAKIIA